MSERCHVCGCEVVPFVDANPGLRGGWVCDGCLSREDDYAERDPYDDEDEEDPTNG